MELEHFRKTLFNAKIISSTVEILTVTFQIATSKMFAFELLICTLLKPKTFLPEDMS